MTRAFALVGVLALLAPICFGQANLATLTGTVTDSGGGVIPGAEVTVINTGTAISREQSSNEIGSFTFPALIPGDYQLIVTSDGFQQHVEQGIILRTGDNRRVDVELALGQVTESVTVDAQLVTLNTENGMIKGDVIVQEEIQELPLNGRDFTDLAFFVPGVVPRGSSQGSFASINGARPTNTNFYVDGFDNRNVQGGAAQVRPNIDALQEFKMETSGYSAEYGRMAGGILNMSLRSGTNQFHGNISYFMRNDVLDARAFFEQEKTNLLQNQFSATATGPIKKNKTFFMLSYELQRRDQEQARLSRVPTPMEIGGDFSQTIGLSHIDNQLDVTDDAVLDRLRSNFVIRDRTSRGGCNANLVRRGRNNSCFPNDVIPMSRADPVAQRLFSEYPAPTLGNRRDLFNYLVVDNDNDHFDSTIFKVDHKIGENNLAGRVQYRANNLENPFAGNSLLPQFGNTIDDNRYLAGVDYTHMFSPTSLMEVRFGFSGNDVFQRGAFSGGNIIEELGMQNFISQEDRDTYPGIDDFPLIRVDNHATLGSATNLPVITDVSDTQWSVKMTNIRGAHTFKYGFNYNHVIYERLGVNNARGNYRFRGFRTGGCNSQRCKDWGSPIADMFLGWLHNINVREGINAPDWRQVAMGAFFNDDWKVTPRLTMNLGVRWEVNQMPWDVNDKMGSYVPEHNKIVLASDRNLPDNFNQLLGDFDSRGPLLDRRRGGLPALGDPDRLEQPHAATRTRLPGKQQDGCPHGLRTVRGRHDLESVPEQSGQHLPVHDPDQLCGEERNPQQAARSPAQRSSRHAGPGCHHWRRLARQSADGERYHAEAQPGVPAVVELHDRAATAGRYERRNRLPRLEGNPPHPPLRLQPGDPHARMVPCQPHADRRVHRELPVAAAKSRLERDQLLQHRIELQLQRGQHLLAEAQSGRPLLARELLVLQVD